MRTTASLISVVLLIGCSEAATLVAPVPDPPSSLNGCEIVRRVQLSANEVSLTRTFSEKRIPPDETEPLEIPLDAFDDGQVTIEVTELGPCGLPAANGSTIIDVPSGEIIEPFAWRGEAACPTAPFSAFMDTSAAGVFTECLSGTCRAWISAEGDACELQVDLESSDLSCALSEELADASVVVQESENGELSASGVCTQARWTDSTRSSITLDGCATECPAIVEAIDERVTISHELRADVRDFTPCGAQSPGWYIVRGAIGDHTLVAGASSSACSVLIRIDLDGPELSANQVTGGLVTPVLLDEAQNALLGLRSGAPDSVDLLRFDLDTLDAPPQLLVQMSPSFSAVDLAMIFEPTTRTLIIGGWTTGDEGVLYGFRLSAGATVAETLYEIRGGDVRDGVRSVVPIGTLNQMDVSLRDTRLGYSSYGLQRRDLLTGALIVELGEPLQYPDAPALLSVPELDATVIVGQEIDTCPWGEQTCRTGGPRAWAKEHDSAQRIGASPLVLATTIPYGSIAGYFVDPPSRARGVFTFPPEKTVGSQRGKLLVETGGRHVWVLQVQGSIIDRYRVEYTAE